MKVKVLGMQLKFFLTLIISLILSFLLVNVINQVGIRLKHNVQNYRSSTYRLYDTTRALDLELNNAYPKTLSTYEGILKKYKANYSQYKLHFIILDGNKIIYNSNNKNINFNFNKAYTATINNLSGNDVNDYYNFAYKIPLETQKKIMEIQLTAVPVSFKTDASIISTLSSTVIFLILVIILFYLLTLPRMRYINKICTGLDAIANGNLDFKIEKKGNDELSSIAEYINHMSAELQSRIAKERELETSKHQLITNVAHDIRSPLTSIIGFLELVKEKNYKSEDEMNKYVGISLKKAETMKNLTNDLFMFTKLNSKDLKFNFSTICFNDFIYQLLDEFEPDFEEHFLKFSSELTPEKLFISVDINMFMRAIQNLFSNALKYSLQPSEVKISLKKENDAAVFSISNICNNVDESNVNMLFERFYRADKSRFNPDTGSGLGLSIAQNIIERHGGNISVRYDNGSICFSVTLKTIRLEFKEG
ncbi:sensor histidine kinase [Clostridium hydrogenum]|uniref:sensor histidine kinase n=1 Tax=Clostridium hydrogenum TaxID=2855764 RepID=UPI001F3D4245|nr:HAMP domain-containing sensor histidine kinase [Clostridium hydrogenum]